MADTSKGLGGVSEFRNRLVGFANHVNANVGRYGETPGSAQAHVGMEQAWLAQKYGRLYRVIERFGTALDTNRRS